MVYHELVQLPVEIPQIYSLVLSGDGRRAIWAESPADPRESNRVFALDIDGGQPQQIDAYEPIGNLLICAFITIGPGQEHAEWHFDSAPNPEAICKLWYAHDPAIPPGPKKPMGPNKLLVDAGAYAVEAFKSDPFDPREVDRMGTFRQLALFHYGQYLHAIQDFYSHTNWIELHAAAGKQAGLAPIQAGCDPAALAAAVPAGAGRLQSGNFNLHAKKPDFCDYTFELILIFWRVVLPAGFDYCHGPPDSIPVWLLFGSTWLKPHQMLAKDSPDAYHGGQKLTLPNGTQTTYHQEARRLATLATTESLPVFHDRVVADLQQHLPQRDPECLFQVLLKGGDPACPPRVGLGSSDQGSVAVGNAELAARLTRSPGQFQEFRDLRVAIQLDPTTNTVVGGSMAYELPAPAARVVFRATTAAGVGHFVVLPGGILRVMIMEGERTTVPYDEAEWGKPWTNEDHQVYRYASDASGRVVVCTDDNSWDNLRQEVETQRQQCVDNAFIELQPVSATPPVA